MKFSSAILLAITAMTASASPLVEKVPYLTYPIPLLPDSTPSTVVVLSKLILTHSLKQSPAELVKDYVRNTEGPTTASQLY